MYRLALALILFAGPALASQCIQLSQNEEPRIWRAATGGLGPGEVRLTYVAHSAFQVETDEGAVAVTDYYGGHGPAGVPDAVTMNHAHETHWTPFPDERIPHVLRGWKDDEGKPADHWVELGDMLIRNVPTNIRNWSGGWEEFGNSIFVFEYEGLCIGHLGHLHHEPTEAHYAMIGRLDVVMAPVDGGQTMEIGPMMRVLKRLKSRIVIPMHAWSGFSMAAFLEGMSSEFEIDLEPVTELVVSAATMPAVPTVKLMVPVGSEPLRDYD
ncbi:MAG: MBL fold metallo-hydrolase [Pseudomonadota bacterium]